MIIISGATAKIINGIKLAALSTSHVA